MVSLQYSDEAGKEAPHAEEQSAGPVDSSVDRATPQSELSKGSDASNDRSSRAIKGRPACTQGRAAVHPRPARRHPVDHHRRSCVPDLRERRQRPGAVRRCLRDCTRPAAGDPDARHRPLDRVERLARMCCLHRGLPRHPFNRPGHRGDAPGRARDGCRQRDHPGQGATATPVHCDAGDPQHRGGARAVHRERVDNHRRPRRRQPTRRRPDRPDPWSRSIGWFPYAALVVVGIRDLCAGWCCESCCGGDGSTRSEGVRRRPCAPVSRSTAF